MWFVFGLASVAWAIVVALLWPGGPVRRVLLRYLTSSYGFILAGVSKEITPEDHVKILIAMTSLLAVVSSILFILAATGALGGPST